MSENFQWGDPYTDPGADNVVDGSVDYYNFHWGAQVRHADSTQASRASLLRCGLNSGCPDDSENCPDNGDICPDDGEDCPDDGDTCPDDGEDCPDDGDTCPDDGEDCPDDSEPADTCPCGTGCGCAGGSGGCYANRPQQTDTEAYPIVQE